MNSNRLHYLETAAEAAARCADLVLQQLRQAIEARGRATIAISGGSTPKLLFAEMRKAEFPWTSLDWFFADERAVPPGDEQSNYKLAADHMFTPLALAPANIFRVEGEFGADAAAKSYEAVIRDRFQLGQGELPVFDVIQLGMGPDGHMASLFPGGPWIENRTGIAAPVHDSPKPPPDRITLLPGVLLAARSIVFLLAGADKRNAVEHVLWGPADVKTYPSQLLARSDRPVEWFIADIPGLQLRNNP